MEFIQAILGNWQEIIGAGLLTVGAFTAFLAALYGLCVLIPGDQPDRAIKFLLDITKKISKK